VIILLVIVTVALAVAVYRIKVQFNPPRRNDDDLRHLVAKSVLFSAIWGTVILGALAILTPSTSNARDVLTILLPVFGTWVGTLLAYYFGKDNYESGARNSANLAKSLTGMDKLRQIPVTQPGIMIPVDKIELPAAVKGKKVGEYSSVTLKDVRSQLEQMKRERLPLIDVDSGSAHAVVHKSLIGDFLLLGAPAKQDTATLAELIADAKAGNIAKNSFILVPNTATLAEVKDQMTQQSNRSGVSCEDAFVTPLGSTKVEGWITNDIINTNALACTTDGKTA
jgi:hypothetical protein